uniref:RAS protein activator like 1 n=1 Tax=Sinocyclocheilus rhinocerous TaxID=307959 RepID=A0A673MBL3_9TELE
MHFTTSAGYHGEQLTNHNPLPRNDVTGKCSVKHLFCVPSRTATVWRNLNPFWGEEYTLHLPMGFHTLTFYVMDEDTIGHDDVIGKISLSKDVIAAQHKGLDNWLNLTRVDPDEEVQGEIHLALELHRDAQRTSLHCHVIEARLFGQIIKKTRFPHWDETLELSLDEGDDDEGGNVMVEVWDWDMVGKKCKLGALRLKVRLAEERILPSVYYQPLIELLVEAVISPSEVHHTPEETHGLVFCFSPTADPNTLFRSNSLASKAMEQFMKVCAIGMLYLHEVLKPIINRIFEERKYVELDPCKIDLNRSRCSASEAEVRESSVGLLQTYLSSIMEAIVSSVSQCPPVMRVVFKQLHKRVEEQFPEAENEDVKYLAISGFFFLRLFAPAILTPKLFQLRDHHADTRTSRTLLLLAKALQSVGNLGLQLGHGKEQWMTPLHPIILCSVASVKDFLDKLIDIDHMSEAPQRAVFLPSVIVKEGFLQKHKAEGPQLLKRFAFKKRYFWLSSETLSYVRSSIPIARVCAVERVDENAFQLQNVMQVITQDTDGQLHTTYLQCKNVNELNQWLSAIRKVSIYNEHMLPSFHPGAHRGNKWTCCLQPDPLGCSRTHSAVTLGDWSDPLDPDAETQIIYKELLQVNFVTRCLNIFCYLNFFQCDAVVSTCVFELKQLVHSTFSLLSGQFIKNKLCLKKKSLNRKIAKKFFTVCIVYLYKFLFPLYLF